MSNKPTIFEPTMRRESSVLYLPAGGSSLVGRGVGPDWAGDGLPAITHPALGNTFETQFPRTRFTSAASNNNELGAHCPAFYAWRGNAASRGGFFFSARFMVNAILNNNLRLFAGLSASATGVCKADVSGSGPANTIGLWTDRTDGASLKILNVDNSGAFEKLPLKDTGGNSITVTLTAGVVYEFVMLANPNGGLIVTYLINVSTDTLLCTQNAGANLPSTTAFMAPQVGLSNALNAAGGDHSFDLINCYLRPNLLLTPTGAP